MPRRLILASASPARARLLELAGLSFDVIVSGVPEDDVDGRPDEVVAELARRKASAVAAGADATGADAAGAGTGAGALVLGCDSMFVFDGAVYGKPASADDAAARWRAMRGKAGVLLTGHCIIDAATGASAGEVDATTVRFGDVSDAEVDAYIASGEPLRVAGAFTLDGLGSAFVEAVDGNPGTVIGVSLPVVRRLLAKLDVAITDLWR